MGASYIRVDVLGNLWEVFNEIKSNPFRKVEGGYQYASELLTGEATNTKTSQLLDGMYGDDLVTERGQMAEVQEKVTNLLESLSNLAVSDAEFSDWTMFRRENGSIKLYFKLLREFYEYVVALSFKLRAIGPRDGGDLYKTTDDVGDVCDALRYDGCSVYFRNQNKCFEKAREGGQGVAEAVLNNRNPFADISICEQQFIYGAPNGFELLSLNTSHILTKVDKGDDTSCFVLQPGFKVKRSRVGQNCQTATVLFDDTLTTEITKNAESIYVYVS